MLCISICGVVSKVTNLPIILQSFSSCTELVGAFILIKSACASCYLHPFHEEIDTVITLNVQQMGRLSPTIEYIAVIINKVSKLFQLVEVKGFRSVLIRARFHLDLDHLNSASYSLFCLYTCLSVFPQIL